MAASINTNLVRRTDMSEIAKNPGAYLTARSQSLAGQAAQALGGFSTGFMPPGEPLAPYERDMANTRKWDYPSSYNIQFMPRAGLTGFDVLQAMAAWDPVRYCIEAKKNKIRGREWAIVPIEAERDKIDKYQDKMEALTKYWMKPNGRDSFAIWIAAFLEDSYLYDAATIARWPTRDGKGVAAHEVLSGRTIKPLIDVTGRPPAPPYPAFQQIIKGVVYEGFTQDQILYCVRNPSNDSPYGMSEVEWLLLNINIALRRDIYDLNYFTQGNVPAGFATLPKEWSMTQIMEFTDKFNASIVGDPNLRNRLHFMPDGFKLERMIERDMSIKVTKISEFIVRRCCAIFHTSPTPYVSQMNRSTAETADTAEDEATEPLWNFIEDIITNEIQTVQGMPQLRFIFTEERTTDEKAQAEKDVMLVKSGIISIDEARMNAGKKPIGIPNGIMSPTGFIPIEGEAKDYQQQYKSYFEKHPNQDTQTETTAAATASMQNPTLPETPLSTKPVVPPAIGVKAAPQLKPVVKPVAGGKAGPPATKPESKALAAKTKVEKGDGTEGGWVGVDLDGTLAEHTEDKSIIGPPVPKMVVRVKDWLDRGEDVRILTARVSSPDPAQNWQTKKMIRDWCREHIGQELPITNEKDAGMIELWDDRAVGVERDTGEVKLEKIDNLFNAYSTHILIADTNEKKNELLTWKKFARNRIKQGKLLRKFETCSLPVEVVDDIQAALEKIEKGVELCGIQKSNPEGINQYTGGEGEVKDPYSYEGYKQRFPHIDAKFSEAKDARELGRMKREMVKDLDAGEMTGNDGAIESSYKFHSQRLASSSSSFTSSSADARADRMLRTRDSSGKATPRKSVDVDLEKATKPRRNPKLEAVRKRSEARMKEIFARMFAEQGQAVVDAIKSKVPRA